MNPIFLLAFTTALATASSMGPWYHGMGLQNRKISEYGIMGDQPYQGLRYGSMRLQDDINRDPRDYQLTNRILCSGGRCRDQTNDQFRMSKELQFNIDDSVMTKSSLFSLSRLLDDIEERIQQTGSMSGMDVKEVSKEAEKMTEKIVELTEEIEKEIVKESFQQTRQKTFGITSGQKSTKIQNVAEEKAEIILRKAFEEIRKGKNMGTQEGLDDLFEDTLKTAITTQMVMKAVEGRQPLIRDLTSDFKIQVENIILKGSLLQFENMVKQCKTQLLQLENQIQFLQKQLQYIRTCQALDVDNEKIRTLEVMEQEILEQLEDLVADKLAYRMVVMSLQKVMMIQEYFIQKVTLEKVDSQLSMRMPMWDTMRY